MIKANHHFLVYPFFRFYTKYCIKRNYHEVKIHGAIENLGLPILAIANHFSWWDGIFASYLNIKLFKRKFYFMVDESILKKYKFFQYLGAYSINRNSATIIDTFTYTRELLKNKENIVLLFPQGQIQSMHYNNYSFEKGTDKILSIVGNNVQVVFIVNLIDYFSNPKPTLYSYIKEYVSENDNQSVLQDAYNSFLNQCKELNLKIVDRP